MSEESSDNTFVAYLSEETDTYGNSFDRLYDTLPDLVAYLTRGPPADPDQEPEPLGGWNFPFDAFLLGLLTEDLEKEEQDRISYISDYHINLVFHPDKISEETSLFKPDEQSNTEYLQERIQQLMLELLLIQESIHLSKQLLLSLEN